MSTSRLKRVIHRDVTTHYSISEMLECGHRYESLALLADPLIAKHRVCYTCARDAAGPVPLPPKKQPESAPVPWWRRKAG
jgi:hypothetical protein